MRNVIKGGIWEAQIRLFSDKKEEPFRGCANSVSRKYQNGNFTLAPSHLARTEFFTPFLIYTLINHHCLTASVSEEEKKKEMMKKAKLGIDWKYMHVYIYIERERDRQRRFIYHICMCVAAREELFENRNHNHQLLAANQRGATALKTPVPL
ncbi:hypothetical protein L6164_014213 [Bauhinia variegata]|uniref:Uncharacterized protein n=1 Tax=Bauhinia variegata TaxID=167791 RepID=A0ACB9NGG2_BAUVA|nr:hypothetical protein L6164_014213 [Bauhinia variegata]